MTAHDRWLLYGIEEDDPDFPKIEQRAEELFAGGAELVEQAVEYPDSLEGLFIEMLTTPELAMLLDKHLGALIWAEASRQIKDES